MLASWRQVKRVALKGATSREVLPVSPAGQSVAPAARGVSPIAPVASTICANRCTDRAGRFIDRAGRGTAGEQRITARCERSTRERHDGHQGRVVGDRRVTAVVAVVGVANGLASGRARFNCTAARRAYGGGKCSSRWCTLRVQQRKVLVLVVHVARTPVKSARPSGERCVQHRKVLVLVVNGARSAPKSAGHSGERCAFGTEKCSP
jgi:hypothetical protein